jgi:4-hydroxybenzoate polyprenyltransferase
VAYALIFGGLKAPGFSQLYIPSLLAFLLNLSREIIKDIEDQHGDSINGIMTSAVLHQTTVSAIMIALASVYAAALTIPFFLSHFGVIYLTICCAVILPIHITWLILYLIKSRDRKQMGLISLLIKIEMLGGLVAVATDRLFYTALQALRVV